MAAETPASKQSKAFASLQESLERQRHKITDVEIKHKFDKAAYVKKIKEFSNILINITDKESTIHDDCQKGIYITLCS